MRTSSKSWCLHSRLGAEGCAGRSANAVSDCHEFSLKTISVILFGIRNKKPKLYGSGPAYDKMTGHCGLPSEKENKA